MSLCLCGGLGWALAYEANQPDPNTVATPHPTVRTLAQAIAPRSTRPAPKKAATSTEDQKQQNPTTTPATTTVAEATTTVDSHPPNTENGSSTTGSSTPRKPRGRNPKMPIHDVRL